MREIAVKKLPIDNSHRVSLGDFISKASPPLLRHACERFGIHIAPGFVAVVQLVRRPKRMRKLLLCQRSGGDAPFPYEISRIQAIALAVSSAAHATMKQLKAR